MSLVIAASIIGEGGGPGTSFAFLGLGLLVLVLFTLFYNFTTSYDIHEEIEKDNTAVGVALGANIIAIGIVAFKAVFGDFGKGGGADYRVQVYDAEGLDVVRTVFLIRLYDGTLDEHSDSWLQDIHELDFFNELLRPVLDRDWAEDEIIDWIIESGFAHNEEQAEASVERESQQAIIRRIRSG